MTRSAKSRSRSQHPPRERGYTLLALLCAVSLLAIAAAAVAPTIASQIRRDRETELIHRAMQYRRAVRRFAKQTGRYPMTLEDLESTNGVRYLRKRYKDPITGKEFRVLHMADIPAAGGTSANMWNLQPAPPANSSTGDQAAEDGQNAQDALNQQSPQASTSGFGMSRPGATPSASQSESQSSNQVFGGGVIIGIASTSHGKTIREFDRRNRYNQWLFFYDPGYERPFEVQGPTPLTHPPTLGQEPSAPAAPSSQLSGPPPAQPTQPSSPSNP